MNRSAHLYLARNKKNTGLINAFHNTYLQQYYAYKVKKAKFSFVFFYKASKQASSREANVLINVGFLVLKHAVCILTRENIDTYYQHQRYIMLTHRYYKFTYQVSKQCAISEQFPLNLDCPSQLEMIILLAVKGICRSSAIPLTQCLF